MKIIFCDAIQFVNLDYYTERESLLETFFKKKEVKKLLDKKISLFLDSGAFSAWSKGVEINIDEYIKFVKKYEKHLEVYAVLDDILSPEKTWKNQEYMESKGLNPLPVFHYGENFKWFDRCLKYDYFALGGMVPISTPKLKLWLDQVWSKIVDKQGNALKKVHGFGLTSVQLMKRYPWYSVDSTSWVMTGRFGGVFCKLGNFTKINISNKGNLKDGAHWEQLNKHDKDQIRKYFLDKGFTIEELQEDYKKRDEANIKYFLELEKELTDNPPKFRVVQRQGIL
jgi:hypothetical protein